MHWKNGTVVLYPSLGVGHLIPMVELAKLFIRNGVPAVTIAVIDQPYKTPAMADNINRLVTTNPDISFHLLPPISNTKTNANPNPDPISRLVGAIRLNNPHLRDFLCSLPSVAAIVLDMFCAEAIEIAAELNIPGYFYFTGAAGNLAMLLYLPYYHSTTTSSFKDMGKTLMQFPGLPAICATDIPNSMHDRESNSYKIRLRQCKLIAGSNGVLVNSFEWLEAKAARAIKDGACTPGEPAPPVYCIGPLVNGGEDKGQEERHACLKWLDSQPKQSVVFLCFGSMGAFRAAQLGEIARGLEWSGHRFLWVVKGPPHEDLQRFYEPKPEPNLEELLPEGFLERTKDRGKVVRMWAPQTEVLQHEAVGAFVTHCGWNSTLEAIWAGLPLVCWPLYAEQRVNKVFIVEEMKIGVEMKEYDEELVKAEEVEAKVRLVMESEKGKEIKKRAVLAKEKAVEAVKEGGSSWAAFSEFLMKLENGVEK